MYVGISTFRFELSPPTRVMSLNRHCAAFLWVSVVVAGCTSADAAPLSDGERKAIADSLRSLIVSTYDLSKGNVVPRLMSLYPDTGRVVSATAGRVTTSRDSIEAGVRWFWENVGVNMQGPRWTWGPMLVNVLSRNSAVLTVTYSVPHKTPAGAPHVIGGAWTAVFERRDGKWLIVQEHLSDVPAQPSTQPQQGEHTNH